MQRTASRHEWQIRVPETQSAFHPRAQRNAFRRLLQKRLPFCALIYIVIFGAHSMAKATALVITLAFLTSCGGPEVWIPQGNSRPAVTREHVQYLDSPPQRPYRVIGIITPPSREYETLAEAVKAMRKEAAKHGADAVYVESQTGSGVWRFSWGGGSGGTFREVTFRAKAIV